MNTKSLLLVAVLAILLLGAFLLARPQPNNMLSEEEAVQAMLSLYPQLAEYKTNSLPPSSIEAKQSPNGWYLGFVKRGSGVPGILEAQCYHITNEKYVTSVGTYQRNDSLPADDIRIEDCTPINEVAVPDITPGTGLAFRELKDFGDVSIRPLSLVEDSRCPVDVTCIQAGTVRIQIEVSGDGGTSTSIVKLGEVFTTEDVRITLVGVTPEKRSTVETKTGDYRFEFTVTKQSEPIVTEPTGACFRGGCSGQLCTDRPDIISTCEYREEYACYQTATCERQASGQCGWTETPALRSCLNGQAI